MKTISVPTGKITCESPDDTFALGEKIGDSLEGGEVILLSGTLGAGKTLLTKGIVSALGFDVDEVTSPSFTLVNLYEADLEVYHIDLWRIGESEDVALAVGLDEILENESALVIIEWAEYLKDYPIQRKVFRLDIAGDGDEPRSVTIEES